MIARRGTEHGTEIGTRRQVVEVGLALLHGFRRESRADIRQAFGTRGCANTCWRRLKTRLHPGM
ncbi:hypothetical protein ACWDA7_44245 [Streptomyces sp. NPDC001156]